MSTDQWAREALSGARPAVYWLDDPDRPDAAPPLTADTTADLVVVGGGYAGLWTAVRAKERDPGVDVVLLEAGRCGDQASGRNGGFASASLTHGYPNGLARWPAELEQLEALGAANLDAMGETIRRYGIDCDWSRAGELDVATQEHQVAELTELAELRQTAGHRVELLDRDQVRAEVDSPTYLAGLWDRDGAALLEPARLAWGLRRVALDLGVRLHEHTSVTALERSGSRIRVRAEDRAVDASQVVLATNAFPSLLRRLRLMSVPVYDYVLMTEPLSARQRDALGWAKRQGIGDAANLFHYYRLTRDDRILWGGYDAVYHYASRIDPALEQAGPTHERLAEHFFATFPQLEGLRFTHRWAGVIDTCTRFAPFFGLAHNGRVAYGLGYTGLGVAATRFGADVCLDLLAGRTTERTELELVRRKPLPFPPEPLRYAGITTTRWALSRADAHQGRRNLWLRGLDAVGLGFDS